MAYYTINNNNISTIYPANQTIGGLFLGNLVAAKQVRTLKNKEINCVITVAAQTGLVYSSKDNINHHVYNIDDTPSFNFLPYFDSITDLVHKYR